MTAVLACWPALWNGFPILMGDSLRYLSEALGEPSWVSSQYYGYFLRLFRGTSLWFPVLIQAAAATVVPWLFLRRAVGLSGLAAAGATLATMLLTPLAFFVSLAMTDVWFGLGVIAALTLPAGRDLRREEQAGLAAVVAFTAAAHPAALPLVAAIVVAAVMIAWVARRRHGARSPGTAWAAGAVLVALVALVGNNLAVWGTPSPNPHSAVVAFAYLFTNGDLEDELANCEGTSICEMEDRPVANINGFNRFLFRTDGPLETELGGPQEFVDEATHLVAAHVRSEPVQYLSRMWATGREQLTRTRAWGHAARLMGRLGEGTADLLDRYASGDGQRLARSRQYREVLDLGWHHRIAEVIAIAGAVAAALLAGVAWWGQRRGSRLPGSVRAATLVGLLVILYVAQAFLIATTTFAVERYGGRMLWLLGLGACATIAWAATTGHATTPAASGARHEGARAGPIRRGARPRGRG